MEISREQIGEPIFAGDVIKQSYRQTDKGISVTFLVNPEDMTEQLAMLGLGEVIRLFVTKPEMGA